MFNWIRRIKILEDSFTEESFKRLLANIDNLYISKLTDKQKTELNKINSNVWLKYRDYTLSLNQYKVSKINEKTMILKIKNSQEFIRNTYNELLNKLSITHE